MIKYVITVTNIKNFSLSIHCLYYNSENSIIRSRHSEHQINRETYNATMRIIQDDSFKDKFDNKLLDRADIDLLAFVDYRW